MIAPRVLQMFSTLEAKLPPLIRQQLTDAAPGTVFAFTFDKKYPDKGLLTAYKPHGASLKHRVEADQEWFMHDRVWFRQCTSINVTNSKYEAFVEFLPEYRDEIYVDQALPLFCFNVPSIQEAMEGVFKDIPQSPIHLQPSPVNPFSQLVIF